MNARFSTPSFLSCSLQYLVLNRHPAYFTEKLIWCCREKEFFIISRKVDFLFLLKEQKNHRVNKVMGFSTSTKENVLLYLSLTINFTIDGITTELKKIFILILPSISLLLNCISRHLYYSSLTISFVLKSPKGIIL